MEIDLYQLIDLVHVPEVNREFAETVTKWLEKGVAGAEIEDYNRKKKVYFDMLFARVCQRPVKKKRGRLPGTTSFYWFELQRYDEYAWRPVNMKPFEQAYNHQYEILPMDIIEKMAEFPVDPEQVITLKGVRSTLLHKVVDVEFVRFSNAHMFGTVEGRGPEKIRWEGDLGAAFLAFFDYRDRFPDKVMDFVQEYAENLMPTLLEDVPKPGTRPTGTVRLRLEDPELDIIPPTGLSGPEEDGKDVDLFQLIRLSQVPEFKHLLSLKLGGLKYGPLIRSVLDYEVKKLSYLVKLMAHLGIELTDMDLIEKYRERVKMGKAPKTGKLKSIRECEGLLDFFETVPSPKVYWFVLSKFYPNDWGVTDISPYPPPVDTHKEVLPPSLFEKIIDTPVDPHRVITDTLVTPDLLEKKVDVLWVRYSSNCVMGAVRENIAEWISLLTEKKEFLEANPGKKRAAYYHALFHYMRKHPEAARSFITTFMSEIR
jgi:hypothetical protein